MREYNKKSVILFVVLIAILICIFFFGCKKKDGQDVINPSYSITYNFCSDSIPYYISIWDVTNLNDFSDSIYTTTFTKTIKYNYTSAHRCMIYRGKFKKIEIIHDGLVSICQDTIFTSLDCFIDI